MIIYDKTKSKHATEPVRQRR